MGIDFPTSIAFLNPNDILVLEKNKGTVRKIVNGKLTPDPLLDVNVANKNERGMLGTAIDTNSILDTNLVNVTKHKNGPVMYSCIIQNQRRETEKTLLKIRSR